MRVGFESGHWVPLHLQSPLSPTPGRGPCLGPVWWQNHSCHSSALDATSPAPRLALPGPALSLPASHCSPRGSWFPPQSGWNLSGFWTLTRRQESCHLLASNWLLSEPSCCLSPSVTTAEPPSLSFLSPQSGYCPVILFLRLLSGATPCPLTTLLSLGDCKPPGPGPTNSPRTPTSWDPACPSWLEQCFHYDVGSKRTPFPGVGGERGRAQRRAAIVLTPHGDTDSGDFRTFITVSPLYPQVPHSQIQPTAY